MEMLTASFGKHLFPAWASRDPPSTAYYTNEAIPLTKVHPTPLSRSISTRRNSVRQRCIAQVPCNQKRSGRVSVSCAVQAG